MVTKDNKIGVFVKIDAHIKELLDTAEKILRTLQFFDLKRITEYKAIYINNAEEADISRIDEALAHIEPTLGGYGFLQPSSTYHRFITGLTGEKMSSSKPESAIFLTDTPEEAKKKITNAKTGGAVTLEDQKKFGGRPDECMIYELFLYHLIDDDNDLKEIYDSCKNGKSMCGQCKKRAAEQMEKLLIDLQEKRKTSAEKMNEYLK
jgi:tryptophanyl-tRNA synthetase